MLPYKRMINPFLIGKRVYLRPLSLRDIEGNYIDWLNDPEVNRYNGHHGFPFTVIQAKEYISRASSDTLVLAAVLVKDDIHIGNIALQNISFINQSAEFAILFGEKRYWGQGYAKEAALLLIGHGYETLNLRRISCGTSAENISMQRLAVSLGFVKEGIRREASYKNGHFVDIYEYGLMKSEFFEKHPRA